jgi:RNA polymerase sigma factor (sigma-70 family)
MTNAVPLAQRRREDFFPLIGQHVKHVYHFVRHRLAYHEAVGDVPRGDLTPEDVVDAVVLRAYREFVKAPRRRKLRSWLIEIAREHLAAEVERLKWWRDLTPARTADDVPETPPTEAVSTLGDEILDFHEPDEDLKLEDVLPDLDVPAPDAVADLDELRSCVNAALAGLPEAWREVVRRRYADGLTGAALARAAGKPLREVQDTLEHTTAYLRRRLVEAGCAFTPPENRPGTATS